MRGAGLVVLLAASLLAACTGAPIFANPVVVHPHPPATSPQPSAAVDPVPIVFPVDDGPHDRLTEWWYYTGHLVDASGRRFGFEFVVFRAERGEFPVSWASHLALTDETGQRFLYDQRTEIGPQVDGSPRDDDGTPQGFSLSVTGTGPGPAWTMAGVEGRDSLAAATAEFGLDLALRSDAPAVLHDRIGYIGFGAAGGSYYYSRPRMAVSGELSLDSETFHVTGQAWFDHQWGDFIAVGGGGWDWFAVNLADGSDLTLSLVRDQAGGYPLVYGTLVEPDGTVRHLDAGAFTVDVAGSWTSPTTGATYPAGWRIRVPSEGLEIGLEPTVSGQELDTRASTGVVYWEGSQRVTASRNGQAVAGEAYVELTGYGPRR